jgi:uncharacterized lipoprotein
MISCQPKQVTRLFLACITIIMLSGCHSLFNQTGVRNHDTDYLHAQTIPRIKNTSISRIGTIKDTYTVPAATTSVFPDKDANLLPPEL